MCVGRERPRRGAIATIDAGHPAMVGLIRHHGLNPFKLTESHQVVAYAYQIEEETIRLRIYDPNWPNRDDVEIVIEPGMIRQSTREPQFGMLALV